MIKSIGYNQQEVINNILTLHNNGRSIDLDPCYNIGGFYKNGVVQIPRIKSDINPQCPGVLKLDVRDLPFDSSSIKSVIFDPPFLVSSPETKSKMCQKYGSFESLSELKEFFSQSLLSLQRVLKHGGLLIFKCQDFVNARQQNLILPFVYEKARELNFACRDLFILISNNRIENKIKKQQHARKYHCYFLVLKNNKRLTLPERSRVKQSASVTKLKERKREPQVPNATAFISSQDRQPQTQSGDGCRAAARPVNAAND